MKLKQPRIGNGRVDMGEPTCDMPPVWWGTKDGDVECLSFFERHYTARRQRRLNLFVGPGEKRVLRTMPEVLALFAWRKFKDDCIDHRTGQQQEGVNCAIFRNESQWRSSDLIRQADAIADALWTDRRHYTYVDPTRVASRNPGWCFLCAGWVKCGVTKSGLIVMERLT
jgi:hypothetical protein